MGLLPVRWWPRGFEAGVPLRVVMFVQSVGVVVAFAAFARLAASTFAGSRIPYAAVFAGVAAIAMTAGNLLAVMQASVRRLLVYAAIAQAGFALAAFTDLKGLGLSALLVFLVSLALGNVRLLKIAFVDPPVFEVAPARLDRGIQVAVALASVGVVFMGLLIGPLYAAASYGRAALLH